MSDTIEEFSRFAHSYNTYNMIQTKVAKELVHKIKRQRYNTILDVGCGSGAVYHHMTAESMTFDTFVALDASEEMLSLHPKSHKIKVLHADFNQPFVFDADDKENVLIVSSSALQWSKDLDNTFSQLSQIGEKAYFSIFTANTFKTLHKTADIKSPIYQADVLKTSINKYYKARYEIKKYQLLFDTTREMFSYIKKSGVSGGGKQLSYREIKQLIRKYPLNYLEFEVLFVEGVSLTKGK
jgi:malonyl-CoA O-methyltransferase